MVLIKKEQGKIFVSLASASLFPIVDFFSVSLKENRLWLVLKRRSKAKILRFFILRACTAVGHPREWTKEISRDCSRQKYIKNYFLFFYAYIYLPCLIFLRAYRKFYSCSILRYNFGRKTNRSKVKKKFHH